MQTYEKLDQKEFLSHIFYPEKIAPTPLPPGSIDVEIEVDADINIGCRFYVHDQKSPNILFFHGNGESVTDYDDIGPLFAKAGMNLFVTEYRGYGWSDGTPTVTTMLTDAEIIFTKSQDWLKGKGYSGATFLMGRSLGSVPAIDLAQKHGDDIRGLIIESGIAETSPLLQMLGIDCTKTGFTEKDGFGNLEKIESVSKPTFILHGARDELISAEHAEKLQACCGARSKEFVIIPGAEHNTMILTGGVLYFQTIKRFIDRLTGASNWRKRRKATNTNQEK